MDSTILYSTVRQEMSVDLICPEYLGTIASSTASVAKFLRLRIPYVLMYAPKSASALLNRGAEVKYY